MAIPISGRTGLYCVFGDPVQHSFSPRLHNKAFDKADIDGVYVAFTVNQDSIGQAMNAVRVLGIRGCSVTMPNKLACIPFLDEIDDTAKLINRGHTFADFLAGYKKLEDKGINVCVHIINGLPGETPDMMIKTAQIVAGLNPHSVKIHLLHVLKGTVAAKMYENGEFEAMSMDDYVKVVCKQLTLFAPETIIQRVTGDGAASELVAPMWSLKKFVVMDAIDKYMYEHDLYQGMNYSCDSF